MTILAVAAGCIIGGFRFRTARASGQGPVEDTVKVANRDPETKDQPAFDNASGSVWEKGFEEVGIVSPVDGHIQKAYFYRSRSDHPRPLVLSLHTWSGDYTQADPLAELCRQKDLNYIHPDFRGPNNTVQACCSDLAMSDLEEAIDYAFEHAGIKPSGTYVIGVSGGGYASICMLMKSKHRIENFSAWVPISDLAAWYRESSIRKNKYAGDVLKCTGSRDGQLDLNNARQRSPLYWDSPVEKLKETGVIIHAGVYDGIQGSVPITQSINFYNKLLKDLEVTDPKSIVTKEETLYLLEHRAPLGDYGTISGRKICLKKQTGKIRLIIFEGNHEMLPEYALNELLEYPDL